MVFVFYSLGTVDYHTLAKGFNRDGSGDAVCDRIHAYVDERFYTQAIGTTEGLDWR